MINYPYIPNVKKSNVIFMLVSVHIIEIVTFHSVLQRRCVLISLSTDELSLLCFVFCTVHRVPLPRQAFQFSHQSNRSP